MKRNAFLKGFVLVVLILAPAVVFAAGGGGHADSGANVMGGVICGAAAGHIDLCGGQPGANRYQNRSQPVGRTSGTIIGDDRWRLGGHASGPPGYIFVSWRGDGVVYPSGIDAGCYSTTANIEKGGPARRHAAST